MIKFLRKILNIPRPANTAPRPVADTCPPKGISVQEAARMVVDQYGEALIKLKDL